MVWLNSAGFSKLPILCRKGIYSVAVPYAIQCICMARMQTTVANCLERVIWGAKVQVRLKGKGREVINVITVHIKVLIRIFGIWVAKFP